MNVVLFAQPDFGFRRELHQLMRFETDLERDKLPNFSVHVFDGVHDTVLGFGAFRDIPDSILRRQIYPLGSLTKPIIASTFLADTGDSTSIIAPFDPDSVSNELLFALLHHKSGLVKMPKDLAKYDVGAGDQYARYPAIEMARHFKEINANTDQKYQYTHFGYAMLAYFFEVYSDIRVEDHMYNNDLGFQFIFDLEPDVLLKGKDRVGRRRYPKDHGYFNTSFGLFGNADMLEDFIKKGLFEHHELLSAKAVDTNTKELKCSFGWQIFRKKKKHDVFFHSGRTKAYNCYMAACPATKTAVVIMCNDNRGTDDLGIEVLRMINDNWKRK